MAKHEFTFACETIAGTTHPWNHLQVVQFHGTEAMSELYRFEIVLLGKIPAPDIDPQDLLHQACTLRIETKTAPEYRVVHGIIAEAQEMYSTPDGMLYRVVVVPPLARAVFRTRCRIFLDKTVRQIIDSVLADDPRLHLAQNGSVEPDQGHDQAFAPAAERYTWRVVNSPRIDHVLARPYVVQYNESDFNFIQRLLEDEGISFHFENGENKCLLVLSDDDTGRAQLMGPAHHGNPPKVLPVGPSVVARIVDKIQIAGRTRPKQVTLDDYNWHNPALDMESEAGVTLDKNRALFEYVYPGGYRESPLQGTPLAKVIEQRFQNESEYALGEGNVRVLFAGCIFVVQNHGKARYEGSYLAARVKTVGNQAGVLSQPVPWVSHVPFELKFEAIRCGTEHKPAESRFRPPRTARRPRIFGSQTAFVTTERNAAGAIVHVGDLVGCVRLKFHWDRDVARLDKEPSSMWVRVSQFNAGGGMGAVWHPRVGDEVIVEHLEGDPDRPLVTGRVYNGAKVPPAPSVGAPTISTIKTFSIPGGKGYNEYLFEDKAGAEEIRQHAARDWNSVTEHSRLEVIRHNSTSQVTVNRVESTGTNRTTTVGSNNSETIGSNESLKIGSNQTITVGVNQTSTVGGSQKLSVMGSQSYSVLGGQTFDVVGHQTFSVEGPQTFTITGAQTTTVNGAATTHADGPMTLSTSAAQMITAAATQTLVAATVQTLGSTDLNIAATAAMTVATAKLTETATTMDLVAGGHYNLTGGMVTIVGSGMVNVTSPAVTVAGALVNIGGGVVNIAGAPVTVAGGPQVKMTAGVIKLN